MSAANRPRRVLAEINWADDPGAIVWIGNRTVHQYWPLLSGYFREILLPPLRRAGESAVSWTWQEPADHRPPSASDLATVRKRLAADQQLFADNLTRGIGGARDDTAARGQDNADELGGAIREMIARLIGLGDAELAAFVGRTERGLRVHSWGARMPATLVYPSDRDAEIGGQVIRGAEPAAGYTVRLEDRAGREIDRAQTDRNGSFRFPKIGSGQYRVFAERPGGGTAFPPRGHAVTIENQSVTNLLLRDADESPRPKPRGRWPRRTLVGVGVAALAVGGAWGTWRLVALTSPIARIAERGGELNSSRGVASERRATEDRGAQTRSEDRPAVGSELIDVSRRANTEVPAEGRADAPAVVHRAENASIATNEMLEERAIARRDVAARPQASAGSPLPANEKPSAPAGAHTSSQLGASPQKKIFPGLAHTKLGAASETPSLAPSISAVADVGTATSQKPDAHPAEVADSISDQKHLRPRGERIGIADKPKIAPPVAEPASDDPDPNAETAAGEMANGRLVQTGSADVFFARRVRVKMTPWRTQLLRDVILPTTPKPAGELESLAALRKRALADLMAQLPAAFESPRVSSGLVFTAKTKAALRTKWEWRLGMVPAAEELAVAREGRAEIQLDTLPASGAAKLFSLHEGARKLVDVRILADAIEIQATDEVQVEQWFELAPLVGERSAAGGNIRWRAGSGLPLPPSWQELVATDKTSSRAIVALDSLAQGGGAAQAIALCDDLTGWALVGGWRIEVEALAAR